MKHRTPRLAAGLLLLTASLTCSACTDEAQDDVDAARDAAVPERDASSLDAGLDGSSLDAGLDARLHDDAAWAEALDGDAPDGAPHGDGAVVDATSDGALELDAGTADGAAADAGADATPESCDPGCPFGVCAGAACAVSSVVANAGSPVDMTVASGAVYWHEGNRLYACNSIPCTGGGAALTTTSGNHAWWSMASTSSGATPYLFVTDNQHTLGLVRLGLTGTPHESWAGASANAGPIAAHAGMVVFGDQSNTYRANAGSAGATTIMHVGPALSLSGAVGPARRSIALDANTVFAASYSDVFKCPVANTCTSSPAAAASEPMPNAVAMTLYDGTLYVLGGTPFAAQGSEKIWSVPSSGGARTLLTEQTPGGTTAVHSYVLLADAEALYWNSYNGNIYTCSRTGACLPTVLIPGARASAMEQDAMYLYWVDTPGHVIYRVRKP